MTDPANSPKTSSDQSRGLSVCRLRKTALLSSRTKKELQLYKVRRKWPAFAVSQPDKPIVAPAPSRPRAWTKYRLHLLMWDWLKQQPAMQQPPKPITVCRSSLPSRRLNAASASAICLGGFGQRRIKSRPVGKSQAKSRASKRLLLDKLLKKQDF